MMSNTDGFAKRLFRRLIPKRRNWVERITFAIGFLIFAVYTATLIVFFGWGIISSFKENIEFFRRPLAMPSVWKFSNYALAFEKLSYNKTSLFGMLFNSVWFAVGGALLSTLSCAVTGYIFAKYNFPGKKIMYAIAIFSMTIPIVGNLPSTYKMVYGLHLNDSPMFLLTNLGGFGGNFLIMNACFRGLDKGYSEACFIDGGDNFYCFTRIMLPMVKGTFFALALMTFITCWNNYETPILFLDKMPTIASGLYYYKLEIEYASNEPVYFAGVVISMIPIIILFSLFSDKIMNSVYMGGLKG